MFCNYLNVFEVEELNLSSYIYKVQRLRIFKKKSCLFNVYKCVIALDKYELSYYNGYSPIWPWKPETTARSEIECAMKCSDAKKSFQG